MAPPEAADDFDTIDDDDEGAPTHAQRKRAGKMDSRDRGDLIGVAFTVIVLWLFFVVALVATVYAYRFVISGAC